MLNIEPVWIWGKLTATDNEIEDTEQLKLVIPTFVLTAGIIHWNDIFL